MADVAAIAKQFFDHAAKGETEQFISLISPDAKWWISQDEKDPNTLAGTYDLQSWQQTVVANILGRIEGRPAYNISSLNAFGNLAVVEVSATVTEKSGKKSTNNEAWFLVFDESTGKIKEVREYGNTALVAEFLKNNPA
ncbi:hypothetical protein BT69DRAFT_1275936 [Atractiella rhizophila]|nr:hypothetical protein BT69DRAFT_1275936 [Atractiella rhizophila]